MFFVAPFLDPVRHIAVLYTGLAACLGVIPLALICGAIRGIPLYWRLIDCSFGVLGLVPLLMVIRLINRLQTEQGTAAGVGEHQLLFRDTAP